MSGVKTQTFLVLEETPEFISIVVTVYSVCYQQYDRPARPECHLLPRSNTQIHKIPGEVCTCIEDQSNGLFFSLLSLKHFFIFLFFSNDKKQTHLEDAEYLKQSVQIKSV